MAVLPWQDPSWDEALYSNEPDFESPPASRVNVWNPWGGVSKHKHISFAEVHSLSTESIINSKLSSAQAAAYGFLPLKKRPGENYGGLFDFLRRLGPPLSLTEEGHV